VLAAHTVGQAFAVAVCHATQAWCRTWGCAATTTKAACALSIVGVSLLCVQKLLERTTRNPDGCLQSHSAREGPVS